MDLSGYSLTELRTLAQDVAAEIERRQVQALDQARTEIQAIARGVGMTVEELMRSPAPAKAPRPARYANPDDATQTWSGVGKKPRWVSRHVDAGGLLEALRIPGTK